MSNERGISLKGLDATAIARLDALSVSEPTTHRALTEVAWRWCESSPLARLYNAHVCLEVDRKAETVAVRVKATRHWNERDDTGLVVAVFFGLPPVRTSEEEVRVFEDFVRTSLRTLARRHNQDGRLV